MEEQVNKPKVQGSFVPLVKTTIITGLVVYGLYYVIFKL